MKKLMLSALGTAALALSACGDSGRLQSIRDEVPVTPAPAQDSTPGRFYELRLRGDNASEYGAALVPVRALRVTSPDGVMLPVRLQARTVDLTAANHAHLVGHFFVPEGVERVQVSLAFDDFGGWEGAGGAGAIDSRVAPLVFEAPVDALSQRGRAVVHLDVGRSLKPAAEDTRALRPSMMVNY